MRESRSYGSVRGALRNERPYRDRIELAFPDNRNVSNVYHGSFAVTSDIRRKPTSPKSHAC